MTSLRIIGGGRAGTSLARALRRVGWHVDDPLGRADDPSGAAHGVDGLVIATPDDVIAGVASRIEPEPDCTVMHLSGASTLAVLEPHPKRASLHPLVALPSAEAGAERLRGAWFAIAGDDMALRIARALGGRTFAVDDADRVRYHATAAVAANHLVALMGQVERLAGAAHVDLAPFLALARGSLDDVERLGPAAALTGPAARGDEETIGRHLEAIDPVERRAYEAMVDQARRLVR